MVQAGRCRPPPDRGGRRRPRRPQALPGRRRPRRRFRAKAAPATRRSSTPFARDRTVRALSANAAGFGGSAATPIQRRSAGCGQARGSRGSWLPARRNARGASSAGTLQLAGSFEELEIEVGQRRRGEDTSEDRARRHCIDGLGSASPFNPARVLKVQRTGGGFIALVSVHIRGAWEMRHDQ